MADIRIKDLTTPASSTASDDFIAVDGTTNGTRKLNAFSPTFGGNATVTGTLTTNGGVIIPAAGSISTLTSTNATHVANATWGALSQGYGTTADWSVFNKSQGTVMYVPTGTSNLFLYGKLDANTLSVYSTTASTTTSTGALVVSGGVGIAKQIVAGEDITIDPIDASPENLAPEVAFCRSASLATATSVLAFGSSSRIGLLRGYHDGADQVEWRFGSYIGSTFNEQMRLGGTSATSSSLTLYGTTASTSTSSGALVVSGGVGVAKEIVTGGIIRCGGSNGLSLGSDTGNIRIDTAGPAGVEFRGLSSADTVTGFTMREMALIDGTTAPSTRAGYATIYVDTADGDLKVKFGDGTVKTIATDS
jgi:hypothetical protein